MSAALVSVTFSARRSSVLAAFSVMLMFVPVSPSGTGKTFSSLTFCLFRSISAAAESDHPGKYRAVNGFDHGGLPP